MLYAGWSIVLLGRLFGMPGVDQASKLLLSPVLVFTGLAVGSLGSYIGYLIYQKIKNTSTIRRIQGV